MCQMFSVYVLSKTVFTFIWLLRWVVTSWVEQPSVRRWGAVVQGRQDNVVLREALKKAPWIRLIDWVYIQRLFINNFKDPIVSDSCLELEHGQYGPLGHGTSPNVHFNFYSGSKSLLLLPSELPHWSRLCCRPVSCRKNIILHPSTLRPPLDLWYPHIRTI